MQKLKGLIAAPFTPMKKDGSLNPGMIAPYAAKLKNDGVNGVFVCGTTGEGMLMTPEERMAVAEEWMKEQSSDFKVIVHVGTTSSKQSQKLAQHAAEIGADAVGCMGPIFLKPTRVEDLVEFSAQVASVAPNLPFYYYHIPSISDIWLPMPEFITKASKVIPNLAGIKFTHRNMMEMQQCMNLDGGKWDILHGFDEELLCGLTVGAKAAVGSTFNYLASIYLQMMSEFEAQDLESARKLQFQSIRFVEILVRYGGGVIGGKPVMKMIGLDCGPLRTPAHNLSANEFDRYRIELENLGFFNWIKS